MASGELTRSTLLVRLKASLYHWAREALYVVRAHRRVVSLSLFGIVAAFAYAVSFLARFDFSWPERYTAVFSWSVFALVAVRIGAAKQCGLDVHRWRFVGASDVRRLVLAVWSGSLVFVVILAASSPIVPIPRSVLLLEPLLTILFSSGLWLTYRTAYELVRGRDSRVGPARRVLVVGAGEAGEAVVRQMLADPGSYRPVAFADDDPERSRTSVHSIKVMGGTSELAAIAERTRADEIVIAVPSAEPTQLRRIVERCGSTGLPFRVLPHIAQVLEGDVSLSQLREVQIEDLLGREPISLELPELTRELAGKTVLITGAAGSIGSELARQVAVNRPDALLLFDQSETGLFFLELELKELAPDLDMTCVVGDVVDPGAIAHAFEVFRPDWVLHAAAYKHVPMMEANEREALRNNVVGTWRVAEAAGRYEVEKFVLVSTDKAVRPANVMGATKRVAEIVILELQQAYPRTAFGAVRFGNVLGSAGSVVPVFKRLLEAGKPLTVTHEDVTRYFMTIPEAAQLVLQASLLPELRGRIAMLDMGQPVRILDLARTLLRLSGGGRGMEPIVFTGLRPGEKMHEELVAPEERGFSTRIAKVNVLEPNGTAFRHGLLARLCQWDRLLAEWQLEAVMGEFLEVVPELKKARAGGASTSAEGSAPGGHIGPRREGRLSRATARPIRRRSSPVRYPPYPYGAPGFVERRNPSNQPADTSRVPQRRTTDFTDAGELWSSPPT